MAWVVRYKDARHPGRPFLALTHTGEWGTSAKSRAQRFATRRSAEIALHEYCENNPQFALETRASAISHFIVEPEDAPEPDDPRRRPKQARTLWDRILDD